MGDTVIRYLREGHSVAVQGVGRFHLNVGVNGKIKLHIDDDPSIENSLNAKKGFKGKIENKEMICADNQKIIKAWNKDHPNNPIKVKKQ